MQLLPGDMETTDAQLTTPGRAILQCNVADHITAGDCLLPVRHNDCMHMWFSQVWRQMKFLEALTPQACLKTHHRLARRMVLNLNCLVKGTLSAAGMWSICRETLGNLPACMAVVACTKCRCELNSLELSIWSCAWCIGMRALFITHFANGTQLPPAMQYETKKVQKPVQALPLAPGDIQS